MSDELNSERRELLERLVTGELDPHGEEGRRLLEADSGLREELEQLRRVAEVLDETAAEEERFLAGIPEDGEDARQAREVLRAIWSQESPRSRRRPLPLLWIGLAAGVLFAAILGLTFLGGNDAPGPKDSIELGGKLLHSGSPEGEVEEFSEFQWKSDLPPDYRFTLVIRDAVLKGTDGRGVEVYTKDHILDTSWTLPEDLARGLPDSIVWSVTAEMPGGEDAMDGPVVAAHRRPR